MKRYFTIALFSVFLLFSQVLKSNIVEISVSTTNKAKKKTPVENALIMIYDVARHSFIKSTTTNKEGLAQINIETKVKYDLIVYVEGFKVFIRNNKKLKKTMKVILRPMKKSERTVILTKKGTSIFEDDENDLKITTQYNGGFQFDIEKIGEDVFIGRYKANQVIIRNINLEKTFKIQKKRRKAKCTLIGSLPKGGVLLECSF